MLYVGVAETQGMRLHINKTVHLCVSPRSTDHGVFILELVAGRDPCIETPLSYPEIGDVNYEPLNSNQMITVIMSCVHAKKI